MITYNGISEDKKTIFYSTDQEFLDVRVEVYEMSTNSFIFSNEITLHRGINYFTYIPTQYDQRIILFFDRNTNNIITSVIIEGTKKLDDIDRYGYLRKILIEDKSKGHQAGIHDVIREHLIDRQYVTSYDIEEGDIVVDIGFNFGIFSLGALYNGASKIYAFEPNKNVYNKIKDIYPEKDKVEIFNYAVSDKEGSIPFYEGNNTLASSLTNSVDDFKETYYVRSINIFDFFKEKNIDKIDFLKVDCEGAEYDIFDSIPDNIFSDIKKIHVEFHFNDGNKIKKLIDKLERNNFTWVFEEGKNLESNIGLIFARKKKGIQKKVALISSYCDNQEKLDVLEKNIKIVKSQNVDVILISPFFLPKNIIDLCDYSFITKDNIIFEWPQKSMYQWRFFIKDEVKYNIATTYSDYGFAGLYQIKQLSDIALNLEYDQFFHMIYDLKIDQNVIQGFLSEKEFSIYPSKRDDTFWAVGLHFMIFNRKNLKKFISKISVENYLGSGNGDAFTWLHSLESELKYNIEPNPVEDEIYFYQEKDFFNFSPTEKIKFFIEKNNESLSNIKLFFYDNVVQKKIKFIVRDIEMEYNINDLDIIDLGFNENNVQKTKIVVDGETFDLTNIISKIKHNTLHVN